MPLCLVCFDCFVFFFGLFVFLSLLLAGVVFIHVYIACLGYYAVSCFVIVDVDVLVCCCFI